MQTNNTNVEKVMQGLSGIAFAADDEDIRAGEKLRALELLGKLYGMFRENELQTATQDEVLTLLLKELRAAKRRRGGGKA